MCGFLIDSTYYLLQSHQENVGILDLQENKQRPSTFIKFSVNLQGGSNMTGTDLCVNKPHCAAAVRP